MPTETRPVRDDLFGGAIGGGPRFAGIHSRSLEFQTFLHVSGILIDEGLNFTSLGSIHDKTRHSRYFTGTFVGSLGSGNLAETSPSLIVRHRLFELLLLAWLYARLKREPTPKGNLIPRPVAKT